MIENKIECDGIVYIRKKRIKGQKKTYVEYRNDELKRIRFFEISKGKLNDVSDLEDLKLTIKNNYIINKGE